MLNSQAGIQLLEHRCVEYHLSCFPAPTWLQPGSLNHVDSWGGHKAPLWMALHTPAYTATASNLPWLGSLTWITLVESQIRISGSETQEPIQLPKYFLDFSMWKPLYVILTHDKIMRDLWESCTWTPGKPQMVLITCIQPNVSNSQGRLSLLSLEIHYVHRTKVF